MGASGEAHASPDLRRRWRTRRPGKAATLSLPPLNYQDWYDFVFATSRAIATTSISGRVERTDLDEYLQGADPRVIARCDHRRNQPFLESRES